MVVIQIKNSDADTFLYETTTDTSVDFLLRDLTNIWNLRLRLQQLTGALGELAKYGPMKPPDKAGLDEINEKFSQITVDKNEYYQPDPTGARTGHGIGPQLTETFDRVIADTLSVLDKVSAVCNTPNVLSIMHFIFQNNVARKISLSLAILQEKVDIIRGAVTMGEPHSKHFLC